MDDAWQGAIQTRFRPCGEWLPQAGYLPTAHMEERREMMPWWADYLDEIKK